MLDLPAPGVAAELAEAQIGAGRIHRLPPELANNKGVWYPQNKDNSCFADQAPANVRQQSATTRTGLASAGTGACRRPSKTSAWTSPACQRTEASLSRISTPSSA